MSNGHRPRFTSLASRLLLAQIVVVGSAIVTVGIVASLVGPGIFHRHMVQVSPPVAPTQMQHVEYAFRDPSTIALATGLALSLLVAAIVSWWVGRAVRRPLRGITRAAGEVASGRYEVDLPEHGNGRELDDLAAAFNSMADTIRHTEDTRRRLLTDVGHELRTPLATMSTHLEGLEDGIIDGNPDLQQLFRSEVDRMSAVARDISAVSRAEEGTLALDLQRIGANDLVTAVTGELAGAYQNKGVRLVTRTDPGPEGATTVLVDPGRISQVLVNLLTNALRHTPTDGTVTVSVRCSAGTDGTDGVEIVVADSGEGIPADQLPHVFERFFRGSTAREHDHSGSGVGLTISRALVRRHGATLTASSDGQGCGSMFVVWLPTA